RADIALRFGDTDRAVSELRTALEIAPAFWPARERLASLLLASGDREDARREAIIALDFNPESIVARTVLNRSQVAE
ncbi:MAG TPA: tetratricopeptide repeat protein, partial [Blastocatellia bacterium]|nr:tetratricopeptide repeat protein [Blastocatellia bacterium]